jgi:ribosome-associated heat shock protein Hsp15
LAASVVSGGHVRLNGQKISKPATSISVGDVLTFPQADQIRVVRLQGIGERRGPAPEAQGLYLDMTPPKTDVPANPKFTGKGRPNRKDRENQRLSGFGPLE